MTTIGRMGILAFGVCLLIGVGCSSSDQRHESMNLDGKFYREKFTCNEVFTGSPSLTCPDFNQTDEVQFVRVGGSSYEVRDVPDTGFLITGTLSGLDFDWDATSPNGYTESGTWSFTSSGDSFHGPSHYVAEDGSYSGDCNTNGNIGLSDPPDPPAPVGCP
jgi:hypothetical protein